MTWEFAPTFDAAHRAALSSGKPLLYVCPPAGWALVPLAERIGRPEQEAPPALVLAPDPSDVADLAAALDSSPASLPVHGVTGLARAARLLAAGAVRTLVVTPADALALARQSALPLTRATTLVLAWPEGMLAAGQGDALDAVLAETSEAQRLIATADDRAPSLTDLLTRIAHRAPVCDAARLPAEPFTSTLRWVSVSDERRALTARAVLDTLNPAHTLLWEPLPSRIARWAPVARDPSVTIQSAPGSDRVALALAGDLPTAELLAMLGATAAEVLVLARPSQVSYLERLATSLRLVRVATEADVAQDRAAAARRRLRERLADGNLDGELHALAPLFDEYDPALVAAAALAVAAVPAPAPAPEAAGWARLFVTLGRKDGLRPGDLVGALINEVGLGRTALGKIDLRDTFALIEVRADVADRAQRGLTGLTLRGKRVTARPERR